MLGSWILLLLMLPGWLVPSGLRYSTCECAEQAAVGSSCCVEREVPPCCGERSSPAEDPCADSTHACGCFIATPEHEGDQALTLESGATGLHPSTRVGTPITRPWTLVTANRVEARRPRGPSPGGPIPLPLRL